MLSKLALRNSLKQFIHLSALGIEKATDIKYAMSKLDGEKNSTFCNLFDDNSICADHLVGFILQFQRTI